MPAQRYFIHKSSFGLGHMFRELGGAALYAAATDRQLVVDWREAGYWGFDPGANIFENVIESVGERRLKVDVVAVDDAHEALLATDPTRYPEYLWSDWNNSTANDHYQVIRDNVGSVIAPALNDIVEGSIPDPFAEHVFLWGAREMCSFAWRDHWNGHSRELVRGFFEDLSFVEPIRETSDAFAKEEIDGRNVVGVHVRHGNGEQGDFVAKGRVIRDVEAYVDALLKRLDIWARVYFHSDAYRILLCTDAPEMWDLFEAKSKHVFHREQWLPEAGTGSVVYMDVEPENAVDVPDPERVLVDSVIDMLTLARCPLLDLSRKGAFNYLPALLQIEGGMVHLRENENEPGRWSHRPLPSRP